MPREMNQDSTGKIFQLVEVKALEDMLFCIIIVSALSFLKGISASFNFTNCVIPTSEINALQDFFESTNGNHWVWGSVPGVQWNFSTSPINPCYPAWQGIGCENTTLPNRFGDANCTITDLTLSGFNLTGTIPESIGNLPNLYVLSLSSNRLKSSIPDSLGYIEGLAWIFLDNNKLSGWIPDSLERLANTSLYWLDLDTNRLSGPAPLWLYTNSLSIVEGVDLFNNQLTGSVPNICLPYAVYVDLSYNLLDGSLSDNVCNFTAFDNQVALNNNMLTGSISSYVSLKLYWFDLGYNQLTGSVTDQIGKEIIYLVLEFNQLTGTLGTEFYNTSSLVTNLEINNNLFTGTISSDYSLMINITELSLQYNLLSGTLPTIKPTLQQFFVQSNMLSGHLNVFGNLPVLTQIDISYNGFDGSLPVSLFSSESSLLAFSATGNCITGSIPTEICNLKQLNYLGLDGISTAGSCRVPLFPLSKLFNSFILKGEIVGGIPECLFMMSKLNTLHLSGNSIKWTLPSDLQVSKGLVDMSLSHNRLEGSIPNSIQLKSWSSLDLSYNRMGGTLLSDIITAYNTSLTLQVNRLSGGIPQSLSKLQNITILSGNLFGCNVDRDDLPHHDPDYENYQCGSNSFNQTGLTWVAFAVLAVGAIALGAMQLSGKWTIDWPWLVDNMKSLQRYHGILSTLSSTDEVGSFLRFLILVRNYVLWISLGIVFVFTPLYVGLTAAFKTVEHQYAWTVSAAYISGVVPAIVLLLFYLLFIAVLFRVWQGLTNQQPSSVGQAHSEEQSGYKLSWKRWWALFGTVLFNAAVMIVVNAGYVVIILNYDTNVVVAAQLAVAVFKLVWNDFAIKGFLNLVKRGFGLESIASDDNSKLLARDAVMPHEMPYLAFIVLFNSIVAPVLASAVVDVSCFYNVFEAPGQVSSEFPNLISVANCDLVSNGVSDCYNATLYVDYDTIVYDPPFIYSYQCTSSILKNYAAVYVIMFLIAAFIKPVILALMAHYYLRIPKHSCVFRFVDNTTYTLLKPAEERLFFTRKLFHRDLFVLRAVGKLAVFFTFGVVFPPLAVAVCLAVVSETTLNIVVIGRFLTSIEDDKDLLERFKKKLNRDCQDCLELLLIPLVRLVIPFAAVFYAFFVFDIYGDQVGFRQAIWAPIVLIVSPALMLLAFWGLTKIDWRKDGRTESGVGNGKEMVRTVLGE